MSNQRRRKRNRTGIISNIIFSVIALIALTLCIILLLMNYSMRNDLKAANEQNADLSVYAQSHIYTEAELNERVQSAKDEANEEEKEELLAYIMQHMSDGNTTFSLLRTLYPDHVVVPGGSGYTFFEITDEYKHNNYNLDNFRLDEDTEIVTYLDDDGNVISKKGIDVSRYNGTVDWKKVKADGVEYAFIRCGYRGSSEGKLVTDDTFEDNIKGALDNDIKVGVYFFTQAISEAEGREEARYVLNLIKDYDISYPVVLDVESYDGGRAEDIEQSVRTDAAIAFLETIKDAGYTPMLYANLKGYFLMLDMSRIEDYDKWFAYYASFPVYMPYEFAIWQYTSTGSVNGIKGNCDLNVCLKEY